MVLDKIFFNDNVQQVIWLGKVQPEFHHCVIDSRLAVANSTFFALQGERVDGHDFVREAYQKGARTFVVDQAKREKILSLLSDVVDACSLALVQDVCAALVSLAHAWRNTCTVPVIGITGSVGKTSTKEMLVSILTQAGKNCLFTKGNNNTLVSVALTLLQFCKDHDYAVIEMGINKRGEMAQLAGLVRPTMAIITGVMNSHAEGLGSLADIAREKRDIFKYFKDSNIGVINGDQPLLAGISYAHPVVKFGLKTTNQSQARKIHIDGGKIHCTLKLYGKRHELVLPTIHTGRLMCALACSALAHLLDISHEVILKGIMEAKVVPGRFELKPLPKENGILINDCYNANPDSMREALLAFGRLEVRGKKIAVLGDMLELGVNTPFWHRQLGRVLRKVPSLAHVIFVGNHVKDAAAAAPRGLSYSMVPHWQEAVDELKKYLEPDVAVLVKASNGIGLKNLVEAVMGK